MIGYAGMERDYDNIVHSRFVISTVNGDIDHDGDVDMDDFLILAQAWASSLGDGNWNQATDISVPKDDIIDFKDLEALSGCWLDFL